MLIAFPRANRSLSRISRSLGKRAVSALIAFVVIVLSMPGFAAPPPPAPPPFLVGQITATPIMVGPGMHPALDWKISLPADANPADYVFFIRQKQLRGEFRLDAQIETRGQMMSPLAIDYYGGLFELWATRTDHPSSAYLLDTTVLGDYLPTAAVTVRTEDPYPTLPRTRVDRPIFVDLNAQGIVSDPYAPGSLRSVTLLRHAQSYGPAGTGASLDRSLATLLSQSEITSNGLTAISIPATAIQSTNPAKARGEERFTVVSKPDDLTSSYILSSRFVQVWPMADATISGIAQGHLIGPGAPKLTFHLNDLYPSSTTWAQVYQGAPQTGITGTTVPSSSVVINGSVPVNRTITVAGYGSIFDADGLWTMELLTKTPFGTDRLAHVSFTVQRTGISLEEWRQALFGSTSNSGNGADANDYDRDGIANIIEFAFGLDPKQNSLGQLPVATRVGDHFTIRFTPPEGLTGILYGAEWSSSLQPDSWLPVVNTGEAPEHVFSVPVSGKSQLFMRLKVTAP